MNEETRTIESATEAQSAEDQGQIETLERRGHSLTVARGSDGKFQKRKSMRDPESDLSTLARMQRLREFLTSAEEPGKPTREEQQREAMHNLVVKGVNNEKMANAAVKAYESLRADAYGKTSPSDDEVNGLTFPVTKIIIVPPTLMHPEPVVWKPKEALRPNFADKKPYLDAEIVSTNPPEGNQNE